MDVQPNGRKSVTCPACGKPLVERLGRRGKFLGCSGYPECKKAFEMDAHGDPIVPVATGIVCEKCGLTDGGQEKFSGAVPGLHWLSEVQEREITAARFRIVNRSD